MQADSVDFALHGEVLPQQNQSAELALVVLNAELALPFLLPKHYLAVVPADRGVFGDEDV